MTLGLYLNREITLETGHQILGLARSLRCRDLNGYIFSEQ